MRPLLLVTSLAGLLAACNAYNPDLGDTPFRCGMSEPRCPLDYTCVTYSAMDEVCERTSKLHQPDASPGPDATAFACADDHEVEPNNSIGQAFDTRIPDLHAEEKLVSLAICPDTDEDYFKFKVATTGKNVRADLSYFSQRGQLLISVLNGSGVSIKDGTPMDATGDVVRAEVPNLPQGTYYVQVRATPGIENNYSIDIQTN